MLQKISGPAESNEQQQQVHEAPCEGGLAGRAEHSPATTFEQVCYQPHAQCDVMSLILGHSCTVLSLLLMQVWTHKMVCISRAISWLELADTYIGASLWAMFCKEATAWQL